MNPTNLISNLRRILNLSSRSSVSVWPKHSFPPQDSLWQRVWSDGSHLPGLPQSWKGAEPLVGVRPLPCRARVRPLQECTVICWQWGAHTRKAASCWSSCSRRTRGRQKMGGSRLEPFYLQPPTPGTSVNRVLKEDKNPGHFFFFKWIWRRIRRRWWRCCWILLKERKRKRGGRRRRKRKKKVGSNSLADTHCMNRIGFPFFK